MTITAPATGGALPREPVPAAPTGESATTLVAHHGGQRNGDVADVATSWLKGYLVYDGPRWFGVYRPADPPQTVRTSRGIAQVWEAVNC